MKAKAGATLSRDNLAPSDRKKVADLAGLIRPEKAESVIEFGTAVQKKIAQFYDRVLTQVRAKDARNVGEMLDDLIRKLKSIDVRSIGRESLLAKIPILGTRAASQNRFATEYERVNGQIQQLTERLNDSRGQLLKDVEVFDRLYEQNVVHLSELTIYVAAMESKVSELSKALPRLEADASSSDDPIRTHDLQDYTSKLQRLERKLRELKTTRMIAVQTAGQIRLMQDDIQIMVERIHGAVLNSIPLWRNQIAIALGRQRQKKTLELQEEVVRITTGMLRHNAEMLERGRRKTERLSDTRDEREILDRMRPASRSPRATGAEAAPGVASGVAMQALEDGA